ncbi:MAG: YitT family protein [Clostridia bacterium]|nr:YitT family protein [Clostridia bacterium]
MKENLPENLQDPAPAEVETAEVQEIEVKTEAPVVYGDKVLSPKEKRKRSVINWLITFVGIIMMSASVYFFQTPNEITMGGVAGIAIVLNELIKGASEQVASILTQGVIMAIINVLLLIIGLIILGKQCTIKTIICSLFYTGFIWLFEYIDVMSYLTPEGMNTLTNQPFLELVYAILLFGIGGALIFNCGASSGGTDIIALILKKYTSLNVGMALMLIDLVIVLISFYTFSVTSALFSLLGLFTKSFLLDSVIEAIGKTKCLTIITPNPEIISEYILKVINHGYTMYDAEGGYTHTQKKVIITVCKRGEALKLKMQIHKADPQAFVIITDANEILGKGFGGTL